jgi:hypothetical protein
MRATLLSLFILTNCAVGLGVRDTSPFVAILQANDDGWGAAYLRALYQVLNKTGHRVRCTSFEMSLDLNKQ